MKTESAAATEAGAAPTKKQVQTQVAKRRICAAVIACLDAYGYSETTINRVQEKAGVTRGALTHHFPSKEAMIVETVERLLDAARAPVRGSTRSAGRNEGSGRTAEADILGLWTHAAVLQVLCFAKRLRIMILIGAAWQRGALPFGAEVLENAIRLNGAAVDKNIQAFRAGRVLGDDPSAFNDLFATPKKRDEVPLADRIAFLADELKGYQDQAYADRFLAAVERIRAADQAFGTGGMKPETLSRAFADLRAVGVSVKRQTVTISNLANLWDLDPASEQSKLRNRGS